jgi:hypothetical protein
MSSNPENKIEDLPPDQDAVDQVRGGSGLSGGPGGGPSAGGAGGSGGGAVGSGGGSGGGHTGQDQVTTDKIR